MKTKLTTTIPPKSGPVPQGLNLNYNTVKTVKLEKTKGLDTGRPDKVTAGIAEVEVKPKGDFSAVDQEVYATDPDGGYDTNPVVVDSLDDMLEGTTRKMEEYATGRKVKKLSKGEEKIMQADMEADSLKDYYED